MGRAAAPPRRAGPGSSNLYKACVECKKRRTLCIRVRRPGTWDFGHAALSVHEPGQKPVTYGNWPGDGKKGDVNDIKRDYKGDDWTKDERWKKEDVRCKELTEEEEKKLEEAVNKKQAYDYTNNNCARWAGSTWNNVTGEGLNYGGSSNWVYNSPTTLADSMKGVGPGVSPP